MSVTAVALSHPWRAARRTPRCRWRPAGRRTGGVQIGNGDLCSNPSEGQQRRRDLVLIVRRQGRSLSLFGMQGAHEDCQAIMDGYETAHFHDLGLTEVPLAFFVELVVDIFRSPIHEVRVPQSPLLCLREL